jgi:GT2 family glycosyltransferase
LPNPDVTFVVPSLGASHYLKDCLESAAGSEGVQVEILLVHPPAMKPRFEAVPGLKLVATQRRVGFSEACNLGIAESSSEYVALLNDDATIEPDWAATLIAALAAAPQAAAAQGLNLQMSQPDLVDGRGLEWNRSWQAIQVGHGDAAPTVSRPAEEIFGVSATAAVFRRAALDAVAMADSEFFDVRLESYYEDVDLACRLRAAGYTALSVPAARAFHASGTTTKKQPMHRYSLIYGNRYLVLARTQGRTFWGHLPKLLGRDMLDLGRAAVDLDVRKSVGILDGWVRAVTNLSLFANTGEPQIGVNLPHKPEQS